MQLVRLKLTGIKEQVSAQPRRKLPCGCVLEHLVSKAAIDTTDNHGDKSLWIQRYAALRFDL